MAINIGAAYAQASQLTSQGSQLRAAINALNSYRDSLNNNWQSREMATVNLAFEKTIARINCMISEINTLGTDIMQTANEIKREEEAAAAAAAAAMAAAQRQGQINAVRSDLNTAQNEANRLKSVMETVNKSRNASKSAKAAAATDYKNALTRVDDLQRRLNSL